jgi:hypothetical protein
MKVIFDIDVTNSKLTADDTLKELIADGSMDKIFRTLKTTPIESAEFSLTMTDKYLGRTYGALLSLTEDDQKMSVILFHKPVNRTFQEVNGHPSI